MFFLLFSTLFLKYMVIFNMIHENLLKIQISRLQQLIPTEFS